MFLSLKGNNQIKRQSFLFYDLIFCERRWWLSRPGGSGGTGGAFQPPHFLANCTIFLYFLVKLNSFQPPASPLLPVINRALLPIGKHFQFYPVTNSIAFLTSRDSTYWLHKNLEKFCWKRMGKISEVEYPAMFHTRHQKACNMHNL